MKLTKFKVENFKCLRNTGWIPFFELTVFTGQNDGGKTSTIEALELFLNDKQTPAQDFFSCKNLDLENSESECEKPIYEQSISLSAGFCLTDEERNIRKEFGGLDDSELEIKRTYYFAEGEAPYKISVMRHADARFHRTVDSYKIDDLKKLADEFQIDVSELRLKPDYVRAVTTWLGTQPKVQTEVELPLELKNKLPELLIFSAESALNPEQEIHKVLHKNFQALLQSNRYRDKVNEITQLIETDLNSELQQLEETIKIFCRDIKTVSIKPTFDFSSGLRATELQLHRNEGVVALKRSGSGQKRKLSLAIYEWQLKLLQGRSDEERQLIVIFDEPDTHLDYSSQRQIFDLLQRYVKQASVQVLLCTHSLNLIERVPIHQIIHYKLDEDRNTSCIVLTPSQQDEQDAINAFVHGINQNMGLSNSVLLHERCFLVVEGPTELYALPILFQLQFKMTLQAAGIHLMSSEGNHSARLFIRFLQQNKRQVLFLVDEDCKTDPSNSALFKPKSFEEDGIDISCQVHFVGTKEFEDAFPDILWARVAQEHWPKKSGSLWTENDFALERQAKKFSDAIKGMIYKESGISEKSGGQQITKPNMGLNMALLLQSEKEIPIQVSQCLEQAYNLANPTR